MPLGGWGLARRAALGSVEHGRARQLHTSTAADTYGNAHRVNITRRLKWVCCQGTDAHWAGAQMGTGAGPDERGEGGR